MTLLIIQWNCNGYMNNYIHLQLILKSYMPKVIFLQETHFHSIHNIPIPPNFSIIEKNTANNSHGGLAMLNHNSIQYDRLTMNHDFDAVGIVLHSKMKIRLITTYSGEKNNSTTSIHFLLGKLKLFSVFVFFNTKIFLYSLVFLLTKKCVTILRSPAYIFIFKYFIKKAQKMAKKNIAPLTHLLANTIQIWRIV